MREISAVISTELFGASPPKRQLTEHRCSIVCNLLRSSAGAAQDSSRLVMDCDAPDAPHLVEVRRHGPCSTALIVQTAVGQSNCLELKNQERTMGIKNYVEQLLNIPSVVKNLGEEFGSDVADDLAQKGDI
jgi:hypothetical protein